MKNFWHNCSNTEVVFVNVAESTNFWAIKYKYKRKQQNTELERV